MLRNILSTLFILAFPTCISAQSFVEHARSIVDTLSSPYFAGRGYLDDADGRAADFIAGEFESMGLSPVFEDYEQSFPLSVDVYPQKPVFTVNNLERRLGIDYLPFPGSASGKADDFRNVVDVGTGLFINALGINDYIDGHKNLDHIRDALVIIEEEVPDSIRNNEWIDPRLLTSQIRIEIAARFGARGVILLTDNPLSQFYSPVNTPIPSFIARKKIWPAEVNKVSYEINSRLDWETTTSNVAAEVRGTESPESYYLVTAHYDHLGRIGTGFFFPGANDNASGVALALALANYFRQHPLRRSIVFAGFSAEEEGLKGSQYFVSNPPFPLEAVRFLINLDMVASGSDGIMAVGGSDFEPEFQLLSRINDSLQLGRLGKRPNAPNSDQYFFLEQGVRGFFLYTNKGEQPYHHPYDLASFLEWDDFMNVYTLVREFLIALDRE